MTGKETAGFQAAESGLYRGAPWVLTPLERTSEDAMELADELVTAVGAHPIILPPARHDRLVASISHLPFLIANALVLTVAEQGEMDPLVWQLAAGGFRDTSRVAGSDTRMFLDILMTNRAAALDQISAFGSRLDDLRAALENEDEASLARILEDGRRQRTAWYQSHG